MTVDVSSIKPWIVLVGGFLGAGKTTLLLAAATELKSRGLRSAVILNDQGDALVDTEYAALHSLESGEVTGGCFCCRFSELVQVMDTLREHSPNVIFAEPVGSCTDISATTLRPLYEYSEVYRIAPFTVLVDLICFTKSDISPEFPAIFSRVVRQVSAKTGQGVAAWLNEVLSGEISAGTEILDIDYDQYARAEAALTWLNVQVSIRPTVPVSPAMLLGPLLDQLDTDFTAAGIAIVHLKAIVRAESGFLKAAICANGQQPAVEGMLDASPASHHELLLNLRSLGEAEQVREIVEKGLMSMGCELSGLRISCFHPAPPKPERRVARTGASRPSVGMAPAGRE